MPTVNESASNHGKEDEVSEKKGSSPEEKKPRSKEEMVTAMSELIKETRTENQTHLENFGKKIKVLDDQVNQALEGLDANSERSFLGGLSESSVATQLTRALEELQRIQTDVENAYTARTQESEDSWKGNLDRLQSSDKPTEREYQTLAWDTKITGPFFPPQDFLKAKDRIETLSKEAARIKIYKSGK